MNIEERDAFYNELVRAVDAEELTWGEAIRKLRTEVAKVNQQKFAKMTKISERSLRHLEQDKGNPTLATLHAVLKPFGMVLSIQRRQRN